MPNFKNFKSTFRGRILAGFSITVMIMLLVTFYSVYNFYKFNESIKSTMESSYNSIIAVGEMTRLLDEEQYCLVKLFNKKDKSESARFDSLKTVFIKRYMDGYPDIVRSVKKNYDTLAFKFNYFSKNVDDSRKKLFYGIKTGREDSLIYNGKKEDQNTLTAIIMMAVKEVKNQCNKVNLQNQDAIKEKMVQNKDTTRNAALWIVFVLVSGSVISLIFIVKFTDYIIRPINELTKTARLISEGNFDEKIKVGDIQDEVSTLANEFNIMSEKLQIYERMNVNKILFEKRKSEIILENINEPVVVTDEFLSIIIANKQFKEVFGIRDAEGLNLKFLFPKNYYFDKYEMLKRKKSTRTKQPFIVLSEEGGENKFFIPIYSFIHIPESDFAGMVIVFNDITKFQELDSMKSEFIAKVSHELKTPLTSLGMAVGLLEEGVVGEINSKQQELLLSMKEDYKRLNKMVFEILELTKIESGSLTLKYEHVEMKTLLEHLMKEFHLLAEEKGINLNYTISKNANSLTANYDYLLRALENLVTNSFKFTHKGGSIIVSTEKIDNQIEIKITDSGIGIGLKQIDKIFDKFYQVNSNTQGSVGLGLSIVKEIVELHSGEIQVKSFPGKGSEFIIRIPTEL